MNYVPEMTGIRTVFLLREVWGVGFICLSAHALFEENVVHFEKLALTTTNVPNKFQHQQPVQTLWSISPTATYINRQFLARREKNWVRLIISVATAPSAISLLKQKSRV